MADDPKQRILDAAFLEFAASGKAGARMQAIAERAQVNQAMLNYYFKSKDDLYNAVVRQNVAGLHQSHQEILHSANEGTATSREFWLHHIEHDMRYWADHVDLLRLTLHDLLAGGEGMRLALKEWLDESEACNMLGRITSAGELRNHDPRQVILHFMSLSMFHTLLEPVADEFWPSEKSRTELLDERVHATRDLLENGLFAADSAERKSEK